MATYIALHILLQGCNQENIYGGVVILRFPLILDVLLCNVRLLQQERIHYRRGFALGITYKYAQDHSVVCAHKLNFDNEC